MCDYLKDNRIGFDDVDTSSINAFELREEDFLLVGGASEKVVNNRLQTTSSFRKFNIKNHPTLSKYDGKVEIDGREYPVQTSKEAYEEMMGWASQETEVYMVIANIEKIVNAWSLNSEIPQWYLNSIKNGMFDVAQLLCENKDEGTYEAILENDSQYIYFYFWGC